MSRHSRLCALLRFVTAPVIRSRALMSWSAPGGVVYANQWRTPWIVVVDPQSGFVVEVVDLSVLMDPPGSSSWGVANGIAFVPATDTFYVTGKGWPFLYRVRF